MSRNKIDWQSDEVKSLLVSKSDTVTAKMLGVTRQRVHQIRKSLGIPSARERNIKLLAAQSQVISDLDTTFENLSK